MNVESSKPESQRRKYYGQRLHEMHASMSAHLSKELREQYQRRALPVRKGDEVKIMRGSHKGKKGKITNVSRMNRSVVVEGIMRKKVSGKEVSVPLQASNLMITALELSDKTRLEKVNQKIQGVNPQVK